MRNLIGRLADGVARHATPQPARSGSAPIAPRPAHPSPAPGPEAAAYLVHDNPRLAELHERYERQPIAKRVDWHKRRIGSGVDLQKFRGSDYYQTQRNRPQLPTEIPYALSYYYVRSIDGLGILDSLSEDGMFGCYTMEVEDGVLISRDLIDSANELNFIFENTDLDPNDPVTIFDIGAGWGRLPHRAATAFPHFNIYAFDAVAESTFLCEFYLRFRGMGENVRVVELPDAETVLGSVRSDIVVNIHSFSETTYDAVKWWIDILAKSTTRYLLIVPNGYFGSEKLDTKDGVDYSGYLKEAGFDLVLRSPLYKSPVLVDHGISNGAFYLFEKAR